MKETRGAIVFFIPRNFLFFKKKFESIENR